MSDLSNEMQSLIQENALLRQRIQAVEIPEAQRKQTEKDLKETLQRLHFHMENTPLAVIEFDKSFQITYWSRQAEKVFGWTADEVKGKRIDELRWVHEDDVQRVAKLSADMMTSKRTSNRHTNRNYRKDGSVITCEWYNSALVDEQGKLISVHSQVLDITGRKQMEDAVKEMQGILTEGQKIAHMGTFEYDAKTKTTVWSEEEFHIYGLNPAKPSPAYEDMLALSIHPDDAKLFHLIFTKAIENKSVYELEHRIVRPDGSVRWVYDRAQPYFDDKGALARYIGTTLDITERKLAEKVLMEREERFQLLAKTSERLLRAEEPQIIIQELCQNVMSYLDCQAFFNFLADEQTGHLQLNAYAGIPEEEARAIEWLDYGGAVCGCAAQACQRIIAEDVLNSSDSRTDLIKSYGIQAYCCHPLMAQDHLIGTLSFGTKKRAHFTPDEVELMRIVTDQVAVAIQRKQAESLLRRSESDLAEAQRIASLGSWGYDMNTQAVSWSDELYRIFGIEKGELDGFYTSFLNFVHPEDKAKVLETNRQAMKSGEPFEVEYRIWTGSNQVRHIREVGYARKDGSGKISGLFGTAQDITGQKQVELALRESENHLRALTDNLAATLKAIPDLRFEVDREGRIYDYCAPYYWNLYAPPEIFLGRRVDEILPPEAAATILQAIEDALARGWHFGATYALPMQDGVKWFELSIATKGDQEASSARLIVLARDITKRKMAEEVLRASEANFRNFLDYAPIGARIVTEGGETIYANRALLDIYGYETVEELQRTTARERYTPETYAAFLVRREKRQRGEPMPSQYEISIYRKNREIRHLQVFRKEILWNSHPQFQVLYNDITGRKKAEEELNNALLFNKHIIDSAQEGIIVYDHEMRYQLWNPYMEKLTGLNFSDVKGKTPADLFPFMLESGVVNDLKNILNGQAFNSRTFRDLIPQSGRTGWAVQTNAPLRNAAGEIIGILGIVRDITEEKRTQEQLTQLQKMESVGRLAGGIAHDFNNMLGVILGHAELAMDSTDEEHHIYSDLMEIRKAAERSASLTRQLLAFARKQTITPKILDLNDAVAGMLKMLQRLIGEDIDLAWLPGINLPPVEVDPSQIDQILANLCVNARDAIEGAGKVTIETGITLFDEAFCADNMNGTPGEYVFLAVSDSGCGMDAETQDKLFEPFFTTKEVGKGTGLGLATVYGIVRQNKGFITVCSEPGAGTTFKIYLPRYIGKTEEQNAENVSEPTLSGRETLLVVEDEKAILSLTKRLLEKQGYHVLTACTPGEAIRLAEEYPGEIHLLITDVVMPEMNGRDLAKRMLSLYPGMRRLFMSGYTADVIAHRGIIDGEIFFLQKPFSKSSLIAKVREALD